MARQRPRHEGESQHDGDRWSLMPHHSRPYAPFFGDTIAVTPGFDGGIGSRGDAGGEPGFSSTAFGAGGRTALTRPRITTGFTGFPLMSGDFLYDTPARRQGGTQGAFHGFDRGDLDRGEYGAGTVATGPGRGEVLATVVFTANEREDMAKGSREGGEGGRGMNTPSVSVSPRVGCAFSPTQALFRARRPCAI